jgi:hypothetical protein
MLSVRLKGLTLRWVEGLLRQWGSCPCEEVLWVLEGILLIMLRVLLVPSPLARFVKLRSSEDNDGVLFV